MKKWNNPEMIDLDVKLTQNPCGKPSPSGVFEPEKPENGYCNLCGHPITHPENFHHNGNHTGKCPHMNEKDGICLH